MQPIPPGILHPGNQCQVSLPHSTPAPGDTSIESYSTQAVTHTSLQVKMHVKIPAKDNTKVFIYMFI